MPEELLKDNLPPAIYLSTTIKLLEDVMTDLEEEIKGHEETAKKFVDMHAYAGYLEKQFMDMSCQNFYENEPLNCNCLPCSVREKYKNEDSNSQS